MQLSGMQADAKGFSACRSDEQQLQEMYLSRKSFAFNSDRCVHRRRAM
jgi:hypothetical protein